MLPHSSAAPSCSSGQKYEEIAYDASGNITSKRNRSSAVIGFVFDDLNRETTRSVPANSLGNFARTLATTYDLAGRKYDAIANGQTISHRYDAAARVDFVTDSYFAPTGITDYGYDAAGNRTALAYPSGTTVAYTYDALNRMDTVIEGGVQLADYDWDVLSRRDIVKLNNAAFSMDYGYEDDDDLATLAHAGPAPVTYTLGRNAASQIASVAVTDGAFLSRPPTALTDAYATNRLNQVSSVNAGTFTYNANGNLTTDGALAFEYDEENRLRTAAGTGMTATYEYDPLGRRRAKVVNGVVTKFVSDAREELEERDGANAALRRFAYGAGIDDRVAMLDATFCGGSRCFYLKNWQGSTTTLVQQTGVVKESYHFGPYGETLAWTPQSVPSVNAFRFTGRRLDAETGMYFLRARFYSASLGRFLQTDPVGARDDANLYLYSHDDPINLFDPTGTDDKGGENPQTRNTCSRAGGSSCSGNYAGSGARSGGGAEGVGGPAVTLSGGSTLGAIGPVPVGAIASATVSEEGVEGQVGVGIDIGSFTAVSVTASEFTVVDLGETDSPVALTASLSGAGLPLPTEGGGIGVPVPFLGGTVTANAYLSILPPYIVGFDMTWATIGGRGGNFFFGPTLTGSATWEEIRSVTAIPSECFLPEGC